MALALVAIAFISIVIPRRPVVARHSFFMAGRTGCAIDAEYEVDSPRMLRLIREVARRGHDVGLHGSRNSYRDSRALERERIRLETACGKAGVTVAGTGNRRHHLRWDTMQTPERLVDAGLAYEETGGCADRPGFRYGTSRPFPMWSLRRMAPLNLEQRPLVVMEVSVTSHLGLGYSDEALHLMLELKRQALRFGGDFALLWHSSNLPESRTRRFFTTLIAS